MSSRRPSLAELMGETAAKSGQAGHLKLSQLPQIFGDAMPELPRDEIGKRRLIVAIQNRFGKGWRTLPGVKELIKQFEAEVKTEVTISKLKKIKYQPRNK